MNLHLQFPPTRENAKKHAQLAADAAWNVDHVKLDYSPRSLSELDRIIGGFHSEGLTSEQVGSTVFAFGCYVGEVFVQHQGAMWKMPQEAKLPNFLKEDNNMMCVELPNGNVWNPIGKAFKLLENGESDSVSHFYHVATKDNAREPRADLGGNSGNERINR
jgi:hypothetical protein